MGRNNLVVHKENLSFSMSRDFNAPRDLVWKVVTDPKLMVQWWGPRKYTTTVDKYDFRVGGVWRFIQRDDQGNVHPFNGMFKEIAAPKRLSYTFEYEPFAGHVSTDIIDLEELQGGRTRITSRTTFSSLEDLEGMIESGMEEGSTEGWDRLEEVLVEAQVNSDHR